MELRAGYKQTEVGAIPDCWETISLGELGTWKGGATPSMNNPQFWLNGEVPWASSGEVKTALLSDTTLKITEEAVKRSSTTLLPTNSVMIVTRSGILRKYLPVAKNTRPIAINQDIKAIIPGAKVDADFLLHALIDAGPRILASCLKAGTTVESVEYPWLKAFKIPLPLVQEQRAIATALSDVDALLAKIDQLIAKKRDLKQAAMQQLLTGQTRLPGFSGEWEVKRLGDLLSYEQPTPYLVKSSEYDAGNSVPVLTAGKTFILGYTNETEGVYSSPPVIIFDDFTTASKFVDFPFKAKSSAMKILKAREGRAHIRFAFERMQIIDFQLGDHKRYWISEYSKLPIKTPSLVEQTAIATVLSDMDAELTALEARRDKTRALKQGMMQALLTGRIRLVGGN